MANFADFWRDHRSEALFSKYIECVGDEGELGYHKRRAATRILARRKYEPAGEVLLEWLREPAKGIARYCYGIEYVTGIADHLETNDAEPCQVQNMAAESLGLMGYEPARSDLQKMSVTSSANSRYPQNYRETTKLALMRLDNPNMPEADLEPDLLLYAAVLPNKFFRGPEFKSIANTVISRNPENAERYIEALRRMPDINLPPELPSFIAKYGMREDIERFEETCKGVLTIVHEQRGLANGSNVMLGIRLFDGSLALINAVVRKEIENYLINRGYRF